MWRVLVLGVIVAAVASAALAAEHGTASGSAATAEAPAEGHGGHATAEVNPLDWQRDLAIWTGVVFLVLLAVLWRFAWGPIAEGLDKREKLIAGQIADAERQHQEARALLAEYQQKLDRSQDDVRAILDQARREAEQVGRGLIDKARQEAQHEQEKALHEIELAAASAVKDLAERGAAMAVELAGKIVQARLSPHDHADLIRQAVERIAQAQPGRN